MTRPDDQAFASPDHGGMTIREYMATAIMAGFAGDDPISLPEDEHGETDLPATADRAVEWADALIAALNR